MELMTPVMIGTVLPVWLHRNFFSSMERRLLLMNATRKNYKGDVVLTAGGVFLAFYSMVTGLFLLYVYGFSNQGLLFCAGSLASALWGWQDDRSPEKDKEAKGFRGHLRMLWREKRVTSGLWKAALGGITALLVCMVLYDGFIHVAVSASLLALTTNLVNLFDLRPARAMKVFWLLLAVAFVIGLPMTVQPTGWIWVLPVFTATLILFPYDAKGRIMLGDTGANFLGFVAGFCLVSTAPLPVQAGLLVLFATLHFLAERISFTSVIESVEWLRRLDQWGRPIPRDQTDGIW